MSEVGRVECISLRSHWLRIDAIARCPPTWLSHPSLCCHLVSRTSHAAQSPAPSCPPSSRRFIRRSAQRRRCCPHPSASTRATSAPFPPACRTNQNVITHGTFWEVPVSASQGTSEYPHQHTRPAPLHDTTRPPSSLNIGPALSPRRLTVGRHAEPFSPSGVRRHRAHSRPESIGGGNTDTTAGIDRLDIAGHGRYRTR